MSEKLALRAQKAQDFEWVDTRPLDWTFQKCNDAGVEVCLAVNRKLELPFFAKIGTQPVAYLRTATIGEVEAFQAAVGKYTTNEPGYTNYVVTTD